MRRAGWLLAGVSVVFYVVFYVVFLGVRPFIIPDEFRYAEIPREMVASGDWVVPRLNGLRYFEKPVLGYWLTAASLVVCGENRFAVRLPGALTGGLSILIVFLLVRRGSDAPTALLAAGVLLTMGFFLGVSTFAVLDGMVSAFLTASLAAFFLAYRATVPRHRLGWLVVSGAACGLALLTKGFLAVAVPVVVIVPFLFWERRARALLTLPWLPLLTAALVVVPWGLAIHWRESDFWHYFFWEEHIRRFAGGSAQHPEAVWFFIPVLLLGTLPWVFLAPAAVRGLLMGATLKDPLTRYAACWFALPFLFFSLSKGKLPTYIMPCLPPFAILMGLGLRQYLEGPARRALHWGMGSGAAVAGVLAVGLAVHHLARVGREQLFTPAETPEAMLLVAALLLWCGGNLVALRLTAPAGKLLAWGAAPLGLFAGFMLILPAPIAARKAPETFLREHAGLVPASAIVCADKYLLQATCWGYRRTAVYLFEGEGELHYGLGYQDAVTRMLTAADFSAIVRDPRRQQPVVLLTSAKAWARNRDTLPRPDFQKTGGTFTMAVYRSPPPTP